MRNLKLSRPVPTLRQAAIAIDTVDDALRLIDRGMPKERRRLPIWRRTRELLTRAIRCGDPQTVEQATSHLERALRSETTES
jgi:hypothetical protein